MTATTLKKKYQATHPQGHYFDRQTMKYFGEKIKEMKVLPETQVIDSYAGERECYVLRSMRNTIMGPRPHYAYFDVSTFDEVFPR